MMDLKKIALATLGAVIASASFSDVAKAEGLVNFGFEEASSTMERGGLGFFKADDISGWQTTDSAVEVWGDGFLGVDAGEGDFFAEINAYDHGSLFQEVSDIGAGQELGFSFMHRARQGTDVMNLEITDLGLDNIYGTADDTTLFTKDYSATTANWVTNTSENEDSILTLGNNMRFAYSAVSTGSGSKSVGNFLDAANFGLKSEVIGEVNSQSVPEPGMLLGLASIVGGMVLKRKNS